MRKKYQVLYKKGVYRSFLKDFKSRKRAILVILRDFAYTRQDDVNNRDITFTIDL